MGDIVIYGAGGFAREVAWLAEDCGHEVKAFVDDDASAHGAVLNGVPVMGLAEARRACPAALVVGGIGSPTARGAAMARARDAGFEFGELVHPNVCRSRFIEYGQGSVICAGNILTTNIRLGHHVQINLDCTIGHDAVLGDLTTLAPGVHVSGWVHFGVGVYVGTGASIINGTKDRPLTLGDGAVVGAGACVVKSVEAGTTVVGVPAKAR